jgi:hypothetical protein
VQQAHDSSPFRFAVRKTSAYDLDSPCFSTKIGIAFNDGSNSQVGHLRVLLAVGITLISPDVVRSEMGVGRLTSCPSLPPDLGNNFLNLLRIDAIRRASQAEINNFFSFDGGQNLHRVQGQSFLLNHGPQLLNRGEMIV